MTTTDTLVAVEAAFVEETRGDGGTVEGDTLWMLSVAGVETEIHAPTDERPRWHAYLTVVAQTYTVPLLDGPLRSAPVPEVVAWMRVILDCTPDEDDAEVE